MRYFLAVVSISVLLAFLNSIQFFTALSRQPAGTVYLGTVHYYEDYFFYLNHFFQGAHGGWLTKNQYTSEPTRPSILYWSNVLSGKLGALVGLSPLLSYNVSLLALAFLTVAASYFVNLRILKDPGKAFVGFLFTNLATSFMNHIYVNGSPMWYPFQLWRTPHFAFDRLGGVPHQIFQTLLFYLLILTFFSEKPKARWLSVPVTVMLMTINPVPPALFVGFMWFLKVKVTFPWKPVWDTVLIVCTIALLVTFALLNPALNSLPHIQSKIWEAGQQPTTQLWFLLLSIGPLSFFYLAGIVPTVKKYGTIGLFTAMLPVVCYVLFFSSIPRLAGFSNLRIIFPGLYVLMGATAAEGLYSVTHIFEKIFQRHSQNSILTIRISKLAFATLFAFFLLSSLFTLQWEVKEKMKIADDVRIPFVYMPADMYKGFEELAQKLPYNDVVLADPGGHIDILVPALSGHTTYSGHFLTTINNSEKVAAGERFYSGTLTSAEAHNWLVANNIKYVITTSFNNSGIDIAASYNFLEKIISESSLRVYTVD